MSVFLITPIVIFPIILLFIAVRQWNDIYSSMKSIRNTRVFSFNNSLPSRSSALSIPKSSINSLEGDDLNVALQGLIAFARDFNPDWIFGIHPGGRILSVLVANGIDMNKNKCHFISTRYNRVDKIRFERHLTESNDIIYSGKVLIIDDISRTGKTLHLVKNHLRRVNFTHTSDGEFHISQAKFATLIAVEDNRENDGEFRLDWLYFKTENKSLQLPWSDYSEKINNMYDNRSKMLAYDVDLYRDYEKFIIDFDFALEFSKKYLI